MARIQLTSGWSLVPEGRHIFRIYEVEYKEAYGKLNIGLINAQGLTHTERFSFLKANGATNDGAFGAFSYFAKTALNDFSREDVDPEELLDHYLGAEVTHTEPQPNIKDPTKTVQFPRLGDKFVADGFDTSPTERALSLGHAKAEDTPLVHTDNDAPPASKEIDLDALLG